MRFILLINYTPYHKELFLITTYNYIYSKFIHQSYL